MGWPILFLLHCSRCSEKVGLIRGQPGDGLRKGPRLWPIPTLFAQADVFVPPSVGP